MDSAGTIKTKIRAVAWKGNSPPPKILVMRFQALGDTIITLPYLQSLKRQYPQVELHFLTREEVSPIPMSVGLFSKVIAIGGGRNARIQFLLALLKIPWLLLQRYDAILDLQNHKISRIIRNLLLVKAFSEFEVDLKTTLSAGERNRQAIEALWSWKIDLDTKFVIQNTTSIDDLLKQNGLKPNHDLVVLNPAGSFPSRNWPVENYIAFANLWLSKINPDTQFVLLLLPTLKEKGDYIAKSLGKACINLTGKTDQVEAFGVLQKCSFVLSEDGGLMHMAWVQGVPTLALFSSTRNEWSRPLGEKSSSLDSSDMECGPCGFLVCKYGDNRCLTRYKPDFVVEKVMSLMNYRSLQKISPVQ